MAAGRVSDIVGNAALIVEPTFAKSAAAVAGISGAAMTDYIRISRRYPAACSYDGSASANSQNAV
jgi:hypothetical protein